VGVSGAVEPGLDDSLQGDGVWRTGGRVDRVRAAGAGRVVAGRAGTGARVPGAGVVQHDIGGICGGDCGVAVGQGISRYLTFRHREQARDGVGTAVRNLSADYRF